MHSTRLFSGSRVLMACRDVKPSEGTAAADSGRRSTHKLFRLNNPLAKASRALFLQFARALLCTADDAVLAQLLAVRPLMAGVLHHMVHDPPEEIVASLSLLRAGVLRMPGSTIQGSTSGRGGLGWSEVLARAPLPGHLQAEAFGDVALQQLAEVCSVNDEEAEPELDGEGDTPMHGEAAAADTDVSERGTTAEIVIANFSSGSSSSSNRSNTQVTAGTAAALAFDVLCALCCDSQHGLVPGRPPAQWFGSSAADAVTAMPTSGAYASSEVGAGPQAGTPGRASAGATGAEVTQGRNGSGGGGQVAAGAKRVLRLLPKLRPASSLRHALLLHK